jgi:protein-tyrosine phosphatase
VLIVGWALNTSHAQEVFRGDEGSKPYTHLRFQNDPDNFQFAVIGDRSGGHRPGVFPAAVDLLNLLRPEFVMSVGDFIEGYVEGEDEAKVVKSQWAEIDELLEPLAMPLFFVTGNHDVNFDPSEKAWFDRVGAKRGYSHFVYKDVLFLMLSTEDPPKKDVEKELAEKYHAIKTGELKETEEILKTIAALEDWAGQVNISDAQVDYFTKVLADHSNARWTIAFMHTPCWEQKDLRNFAKIEALLADRPYTVFAGHTHTYKYTRRKGRDYITMGMTGAGVQQTDSVGNMDHVAWVTMTKEGPVISNLLLNGILDKRGALPTMRDFLLYRPRQITQVGQSLGVKSVPNLRDLGGYQTTDGATVASGLLYRSNQLHNISPDDMQKLAQLGLKNSFDLRTLAEREIRPDELPPEVSCVWLDVLADAPDAGPAMLEKLMENPKEANAALGGGKAEEGFAASYRQFVSLPSAKLEFRKLFLSLADERELPALFHCTTGKDRTGWAAAALLTLLGVPRETVMEDYLRSNDNILPAYKKVIDGFVAAGGEERIPLAILGVKKEYLDAAFDEMESEYGTIEKYFSEGLRIDADRQQAIRELYLGKK